MQQNSDENLIRFVTRFSELLERHLESIQALMSGTVQSVMQNAMEMERTATTSRETAEAQLAASFENPDAETTTLMEGMQKVVADLFEDALAKTSQSTTANPQVNGNATVALLQEANRKRPSVMKELDEKLSALAVNAMGALSSEDVMVQRIEHIILAARGLETALSYLLLDFGKRGSEERLNGMYEDLLDFTFRQYTSEEEKREFQEVFSEWKISA